MHVGYGFVAHIQHVNQWILHVSIGSVMQCSCRTTISAGQPPPRTSSLRTPSKMSVIEHCALDVCCTAKSLTHLPDICMIHTSEFLSLGYFDQSAHHLRLHINLSTIALVCLFVLSLHRWEFRLTLKIIAKMLREVVNRVKLGDQHG